MCDEVLVDRKYKMLLLILEQVGDICWKCFGISGEQ